MLCRALVIIGVSHLVRSEDNFFTTGARAWSGGATHLGGYWTQLAAVSRADSRN